MTSPSVEPETSSAAANDDNAVPEEEIAQVEESFRTMAEAMHQSAESGSFHRERDLAVEARYRRWLLRAEEIRRLPPEERSGPWQALMAETRRYVMK